MFKKIQIPSEWTNIETIEDFKDCDNTGGDNLINENINTNPNSKKSMIDNSNKVGKWIPPKQNLGASQFAAALGLNKFLDSDTLKHQLENGYMFTESSCIRFGNEKEKLAKYFYQKLTGCKLKRGNFVKDVKHPQIVGICDGLVGYEGGLEIKCHYPRDDRIIRPLKVIPIYYLVQIAGYLHLYNRLWWDFMSCCFNDKDELCTYRIIRVTREEVHDAWTTEWYPKLIKFINSIGDQKAPKTKTNPSNII